VVLAEENIKKVECIDFPQLGMEAVWNIEVEDFPAFILVDDKGNDFFKKLGLFLIRSDEKRSPRFADASRGLLCNSPGESYLSQLRPDPSCFSLSIRRSMPRNGSLPVTAPSRSGHRQDHAHTKLGESPVSPSPDPQWKFPVRPRPQHTGPESYQNSQQLLTNTGLE
jgi:hypothetical protein